MSRPCGSRASRSAWATSCCSKARPAALSGSTRWRYASLTRNGQECGFGRAVVRWLLLVVDAFFCFLVGLITALSTTGHQRVGDLVAKTYVVSARDLGAPPVAPAYGSVAATRS